MKLELGTVKIDGQDKPVSLDLDKLTTHTFVTGTTGSGKTGVLMNFGEHYVEAGIPAIYIDVKGDMCNLALQYKNPALRDKMYLRVITPGAEHGTPVHLFANLQKPERIKTAVTQILKMCGERKINPLESRAHTMLSALLHHYHETNVQANLVNLIQGLLEPPFLTMGALPLEEHMPAKSRSALAAKLNNLVAAPSFRQWRHGTDLNVDQLLDIRGDGKTNVTIYSVAHLDEDQKMFAIALLFESIVGWMRRQSGTDSLRAALFVDECVGILPPYPKNPPTKSPLVTMLKQGRAYGLGVHVASQNPKDLCYRALSNCKTWIIGKLAAQHDRDRVIEGMAVENAIDTMKVNNRIRRLTDRRFVLVRPSSTCDFTSKEVTADLIGPMTPYEIEEMQRLWQLYKSADVENFVDHESK